MKRVFLGGTCNGSNWRDILIPKLKIEFFNPVVADWTEAAQERELLERKQADFVLYVLTPKMRGVYAVAEVADDSNKRPEKTILCILTEDSEEIFDAVELRSLTAVKDLILRNGAGFFSSLDLTAEYLNSNGKE